MERERVLITGISGFVGSHLAEFLLERGMEVYGTIRWRSKLDNIKHAYWLSLQKCEFGEVYNICTGVARKIHTVCAGFTAGYNRCED